MRLLTRDTDYAIRVLLHMARNSGRVFSTGELTKDLGVPRPFIRKFLYALGRHKILKSTKGKGGGFGLKVKPSKIRIIDLMKIFQGAASADNCMFNKKICPNRKCCPLRAKIKDIEEKISSGFAAITIASLIAK